MGAVVVRAPLRVALGGGGTDLPAYYREHGGLVVSTAIDRYVHMTVTARFQRRFVLKHLEWEEVDDPGEVRHPILRAALDHHWHGGPIELASVGDVLGRLIGKQDQYAAAFGGVRAYAFKPDDRVEVRQLRLSDATRVALRDRFLLFFTGQRRSASDILGAGQAEEALHLLKELAGETCTALEAGDLERVAELIDEHWEAKRRRSAGTVTDEMEALRDQALRAGARGVISLGAGGGGFLLVYAPDPDRTRAALAADGVPELAFGLDDAGATTLR